MLALISCSDSDKQLKQTKTLITHMQQTTKTVIEPLPNNIPSKVNTTIPIIQRDPFISYQIKPTSLPSLDHPHGFLDNLALNQLNYVGMLASNNYRCAIIQTPDNKIYAIHIGEYIGQEHGQIIKITDQSLMIQVSITTDLNRTINKIQELSLNLSNTSTASDKTL